MLRNYLASLSFANLVYLRAWADLLPAKPSDAFLRKTLAGPGLYFAVASDVLMLSLLTFLVVSIAPKLPGWLQRVLPLVALAMVVLAIRSVSTAALVRSGLFTSALAALLALVVTGLAIRFFFTDCQPAARRRPRRHSMSRRNAARNPDLPARPNASAPGSAAGAPPGHVAAGSRTVDPV